MSVCQTVCGGGSDDDVRNGAGICEVSVDVCLVSERKSSPLTVAGGQGVKQCSWACVRFMTLVVKTEIERHLQMMMMMMISNLHIGRTDTTFGFGFVAFPVKVLHRNLFNPV